MTAVEWDFLHHILVDHLAHSDAGGIYDGLRTLDGHNDVGTGHLETEILNRVLADLKRQRLGDLAGETLCLYFHTVAAGRQGGHFVVTRGVGLRGSFNTERVTRDDNLRVCYGRPTGVRNCSLDAGGGL